MRRKRIRAISVVGWDSCVCALLRKRPGETAFGDPSHAAFNEQLNAPSEPTHDPLTSPWISPDQHPAMHQEFADNSDPTMKAQRLAQELTEAERRREQIEESGGTPFRRYKSVSRAMLTLRIVKT